MDKSKKKNMLSESNSPYLLQHQDNPVAWYEWGEQAFAAARETERLIFLSIGYSTCHWCHVMAHESFEDEKVAEILNENFIAIKVDREERPDIDKIYMDVCQAMTGSGGWPLTLIMTPEQIPIFAGTYFPKEAKYGRPGLIDILIILADKWRKQRDKLMRQAQEIGQAFSQTPIPDAAGLIPQMLDAAVQNIARAYDPRYGGFGSAPKFPMGHLLLFLARHAGRNKDQVLLQKVENTLLKMYHGGLFDQVGFGFYRYSTDEKWLIPHFEKMLYDNALLIMAAVELYSVTRNQLYAEIVDKVFTYLQRDLTSPEGAFFCAEDADSEGEEGRFYVFSAAEFADLAGSDAAIMQQFFGVSAGGNFEGANHLHINEPIVDFCRKRGLNQAEFVQKVEVLRQKLLDYRGKRVRPSRDDKVLTAWNGLMIKALAEAGKVLQRSDYIAAASRAAAFVLNNLKRNDNSLYRSWRRTKASIDGFLEDYVFLTAGLLELFQAEFNADWLRQALELHRYALENFVGEQSGVFFESEIDSEKLLNRPYNQYDGAMPSAVAQLALNAISIGHLCADPEQLDIAGKIIERAGRLIKEAPSGFAWHLAAYDLLVNPGDCLMIFAQNKEEAQPFIEEFRRHYRPGALIVVLRDENVATLKTLMPQVAEISAEYGPSAIICRQFSCLPPVKSLEDLKALIDQ
jgi:uncharacterized protein YyaL (SSP411 family)